MKKTRIANKGIGGMSLLEVMAAVFVLTIVAVPLLNMFVFNTKLVTDIGKAGDTTYFGQAVMEKLSTSAGYGNLYSRTDLPKPGETKPVTINALTKNVKIDRQPYGAFNSLVSGEACYAHLIVNGGSATFTCPDGKTYTGLSYAAGIAISSTQVTIGGVKHNLNKPAGARMILIVNAGKAAVAGLQVTLPADRSVPYVLYALSPADGVVQDIEIVNGHAANSKEYRKYSSAGDPPPATMLVKAVCTVYGGGNAVESIVQDVLQVGLP